MWLLRITEKDIRLLNKIVNEQISFINKKWNLHLPKLILSPPQKILEKNVIPKNKCFSMNSKLGGNFNNQYSNIFHLMSRSRMVNVKSVRYLSVFRQYRIDYLEHMANENKDNANQQALYLMSVVDLDPHYVIRRVESGKYAVDNQVRNIYTKAIEMVKSSLDPESATYARHANQSNENRFKEFVSKFVAFSLRLFTKFLLFMMFISILRFFLSRNMDKKGSKNIDFSSFLNSRYTGGQEINPETVKVRFSDVRGNEETKEEVMELVDFLKNPKKYTQLGGRISHGVLLVGPPGTGKTLLAKAVAGEANVPFFYATGSEFEEMFVGVGASRIRRLFERARASSPCIIFIDELDAVGGKRSKTDFSSATRMTLNQLLTEMDGFKDNNIIVIGATNSPEVLDPALVRAGRFDIQINVPLPCYKDRIDILDYYLQKISQGEDIKVDRLASLTPGASGADLSNLVNQGAIRAVTVGRNSVIMEDLEWARDKMLMGRERKSFIFTEEEKKITAYHEAGHAIVAYYTEGARKVHKATIIPRGSSLGMTQLLPDRDETSMSYKQLIAQIDVCMGGRVAEELIFGKENITTGCASDLKNATSIAKKMVSHCGFSPTIGYLSLNAIRSSSSGRPSGELDTLVHEEVKKILDDSYKRVTKLLTSYRNKHHLLAQALTEQETLDVHQIEAVLA